MGPPQVHSLTLSYPLPQALPSYFILTHSLDKTTKTTFLQFLSTFENHSPATMCSSDLFLCVLAILFPPLPVWVKRGICSADSIINILLLCLGFIPGLIHAWYIIAKFPDPEYDYDPVPQDAEGAASATTSSSTATTASTPTSPREAAAAAAAARARTTTSTTAPPARPSSNSPPPPTRLSSRVSRTQPRGAARTIRACPLHTPRWLLATTRSRATTRQRACFWGVWAGGSGSASFPIDQTLTRDHVLFLCLAFCAAGDVGKRRFIHRGCARGFKRPRHLNYSNAVHAQ
uniref:Stress response RCI peptide n=1 Tax=Bionectria ochroleuca TaxID=29856 RepID=A0A8H7K992_BIOOC